jgi:hypothetical protein
MRVLLDPVVSTEGTPKVESPATPDLGKGADALVAKHGDPTSALRVLMAENYDYRDKLRDLKAKLPADGSVVLAGDDAKAYARYKALGDPKDLEKAVTERDHFREEADGFRREKLHGEAAKLHGFKSSVLSRLVTTDGLELVILDGKDKVGKPAKSAHVKGEGDKTTPLADYAKANWGDFLPALQLAEQPSASPGGTPSYRTPAPRPLVGATNADGTPVRRVNSL